MEHLKIEGGHEYLPFARSRVKALRATGQKYVSQQFNIGGAMVRVQLVDVHEYISISGGRAGYEFWCADQWYVNAPYPGATGSGTRDFLALDSQGVRTLFVSGGAVEVFGGANSNPIYATALQPLPDGRQWPLLTYSDRNLVRADLANAVANWQKINPKDFFTNDSWADQSFQQMHWWYDNEPQQMVHSTGATGPGTSWANARYKWHGINPHFTYKQEWAGLTASFARFAGEMIRPSNDSQIPNFYLTDTWSATIDAQAAAFTKRLPVKFHEGDEVFDIRPTAYFIRDGYKHGGHKRTPQANWRHAAVIKATTQDGAMHSYFVSTDTHGVFTFYRARDWVAHWFASGQPESWEPFDIPDTSVKIVRPDYPSWVTVTADGVSTTDDHWQWHFNKDATKAATTPLKVEDSFVNIVVRYNPTRAGQIVYEPINSDTNNTRFGSGEFRTNLNLYPVRRVQVFQFLAESAQTNLLALYGPWLTTAGLTSQQVNEHLGCLGCNFAFDIDGKLYPAYFGFGQKTSVFDNAIGLPTALTLPREKYSPMKATTPGFVEVSLALSINGNDPDDFTPTVTVTSSEAYADKKSFYMDVGYYIQTPRISKEEDPIAEDTLLTAEIEVFHRHVENEYSGFIAAYTDNVPGSAGYDPDRANEDFTISKGQQRPVIPLHSPAFANSKRIATVDFPFPYAGTAYLQADRTRDSLEDWMLGDHCGVHLYVYYTVRERHSQKIVKRFCLAHDVQWHQGEFNWLDNHGRSWWTISTANGIAVYADYSTPATFFGTVEQGNLRFLNFLTSSRASKAFVDDGLQGREIVPPSFVYRQWAAFARPPAFADRSRFTSLAQNMLPRFELRIHGQPIRAVDYSRPEVTGFDTPEFGNDPMTKLATPPADAVRLPAKPDDNSFTFCFLQWCAQNFVTITHSETFSFCPDGSYAVYADRRSVGMPIGGTTTEAELATGGVFDVIHDHPAKKTTTHKKTFNAAFEQSRDYSYWDASQGDMGGFATTGIWTGKPTS